ncbi:MAG: hypothetical protein CSB47_07400 [Proteobacteria bacterium]|nr:MAG: hypothetical protein CSB47_07400 [Pseudomonadota bacterium]
MPAQCPLCNDQHIRHFFRDHRDYWQCGHCLLLFVEPSQQLAESDEKVRYDLHENDIDNAGYCAFLGKLLEPLAERLPVGARGLDFGCGPGPTLSRLLEKKGFQVACYDKYFRPDADVLEQRYDFITSTEVLEHLRDPKSVINQLVNCLNPRAYLGIMTCLLPKQCDFAGWHYKRDPTHITFYSTETFEWIAEHWHLDLEILGKDVIILGRGN